MDFHEKDSIHNGMVLSYILGIATLAHLGQTRKGTGEPYITHPVAVQLAASKIDPTDYRTQAVALLHDVVEDTKLTYDDLLAMEVPPEVVAGVIMLTRSKDQTYEEYIRDIIVLGTRETMLVKKLDLEHNLSCDPPVKLRKRYRRALKKIEEALQFHGRDT